MLQNHNNPASVKDRYFPSLRLRKALLRSTNIMTSNFTLSYSTSNAKAWGSYGATVGRGNTTSLGPGSGGAGGGGLTVDMSGAATTLASITQMVSGATDNDGLVGAESSATLERMSSFYQVGLYSFFSFSRLLFILSCYLNEIIIAHALVLIPKVFFLKFNSIILMTT